MQHLGEVCMAQRSRGRDIQDTRRVKARREIQKRSFWRRFFSSFLSLLKEKRPPEAKRESSPRRGAECPFGQSAARVFRACGRGERIPTPV